MNNIYHGRLTTLAAQFETAFRTAPAVPGAQLLKFDEFTIGRDAVLQDDNTINGKVLMEKRDYMDSSISATGKHIMCLNDLGYFLKALLGDPVTTGVAAPYTHTYTLSLADRPSLLLELAINAGAEFRRFLGLSLNEIVYDLMNNDQSFTTGWIGACEVLPAPTVAWDAAVAGGYAKQRACTKSGNVYDVFGASTLGDISAATITINNGLAGQALADAQEGFGRILVGQPAITGKLSGLFEAGSLHQAAEANQSKKVVMKTANAAGDASLTITLPHVEFDVPKTAIKSSKGMIYDLSYRAHNVTGDAAPTFVLVNSIAAY